MPKADIAIVTVLPEEYSAVNERLKKEGCVLQHHHGSASQPNQCGWATGEVIDQIGQCYYVVVAMTSSPGPTQMTSVVTATLARFKPRYVLLVGIAGGFPHDRQSHGDVAISKVIYDYEYGKLTEAYIPRHDNTYQVDEALLRSAMAFHSRDSNWSELDNELRPTSAVGLPKLRSGVFASGSKVVDNAENHFFAAVYTSWPKLLAVEMEAAGAAVAVNSAVSSGQKVGFLMIRGISDMPKVGGGDDIRQLNPTENTEGNKAERDTWKKYAAAVAANFTVHWIKRGWPAPPAIRRAARTSGTKPPDVGDDDQPPPPTAAKLDPKAVGFEPFTVVTDSSIWLGFDRALFPAGGDSSRGGPILGGNAERLERSDSSPESVFDICS